MRTYHLRNYSQALNKLSSCTHSYNKHKYKHANKQTNLQTKTFFHYGASAPSGPDQGFMITLRHTTLA